MVSPRSREVIQLMGLLILRVRGRGLSLPVRNDCVICCVQEGEDCGRNEIRGCIGFPGCASQKSSNSSRVVNDGQTKN